MENNGFKIETDSDEASEDVGEESGDEETKGVKKTEKVKQMEMSKEHKPMKKSDIEIKKSQFLGEKYGHYKLGVYVRIEMQVEKKFARQLQPEYPMVLCSLKHQETGMAFVRVKIKKHRWYPHVLKTKDPVTFSMGWRKF
jgi:ribosome biogenesis protein BMS1